MRVKVRAPDRMMCWPEGLTPPDARSKACRAASPPDSAEAELHDLVIDGERVAALREVLQARRRLVLIVGVRQRREGDVGGQRQVDIVDAVVDIGAKQRERLVEGEVGVADDDALLAVTMR